MQVFMAFIERKGLIILWISVLFSLLDFNLCNFFKCGKMKEFIFSSLCEGGVLNGPSKFSSACKIGLLLDFLEKF